MAEFPLTSKAEFTFKASDREGHKIIVKTLNEYYKGAVSRAVSLAANLYAAPYKEGGTAHAMVKASMKASSPEEQAAFLAQEAYLNFEFDSKAEEKYPMPPTPERGVIPPSPKRRRKKDEEEAGTSISEEGEVESRETNEAFMKRLDAYNKECTDITKKRNEEVERLHQSALADFLALSNASRTARCVDAYGGSKYREEFNRLWKPYTIYYACRVFEDTSELYFGDDPVKGVKIVLDLDDVDKKELFELYDKVDSVSGSEIPT